eukprot:TRINITY_DN6576_c2_g1_i1.p1 TRINITY_DN6576_c2_g1~~TRINITY_DN6576_c2_g1_i1.p1  ORF type:complete len:1022 (+),score=157.27 TRINITY_DN6576_c2_g1_i1:97-3162(+)
MAADNVDAQCVCAVAPTIAAGPSLPYVPLSPAGTVSRIGDEAVGAAAPTTLMVKPPANAPPALPIGPVEVVAHTPCDVGRRVLGTRFFARIRVGEIRLTTRDEVDELFVAVSPNCNGTLEASQLRRAFVQTCELAALRVVDGLLLLATEEVTSPELDGCGGGGEGSPSRRAAMGATSVDVRRFLQAARFGTMVEVPILSAYLRTGCGCNDDTCGTLTAISGTLTAISPPRETSLAAAAAAATVAATATAVETAEVAGKAPLASTACASLTWSLCLLVISFLLALHDAGQHSSVFQLTEAVARDLPPAQLQSAYPTALISWLESRAEVSELARFSRVVGGIRVRRLGANDGEFEAASPCSKKTLVGALLDILDEVQEPRPCDPSAGASADTQRWLLWPLRHGEAHFEVALSEVKSWYANPPPDFDRLELQILAESPLVECFVLARLTFRAAATPGSGSVAKLLTRSILVFPSDLSHWRGVGSWAVLEFQGTFVSSAAPCLLGMCILTAFIRLIGFCCHCCNRRGKQTRSRPHPCRCGAIIDWFIVVSGVAAVAAHVLTRRLTMGLLRLARRLPPQSSLEGVSGGVGVDVSRRVSMATAATAVRYTAQEFAELIAVAGIPSWSDYVSLLDAATSHAVLVSEALLMARVFSAALLVLVVLRLATAFDGTNAFAVLTCSLSATIRRVLALFLLFFLPCLSGVLVSAMGWVSSLRTGRLAWSLALGGVRIASALFLGLAVAVVLVAHAQAVEKAAHNNWRSPWKQLLDALLGRVKKRRRIRPLDRATNTAADADDVGAGGQVEAVTSIAVKEASCESVALADIAACPMFATSGAAGSAAVIAATRAEIRLAARADAITRELVARVCSIEAATRVGRSSGAPLLAKSVSEKTVNDSRARTPSLLANSPEPEPPCENENGKEQAAPSAASNGNRDMAGTVSRWVELQLDSLASAQVRHHAQFHGAVEQLQSLVRPLLPGGHLGQGLDPKHIGRVEAKMDNLSKRLNPLFELDAAVRLPGVMQSLPKDW